MQILAATDFSTRSNRAVRQAGLLAQAAGSRLAVVHVVDDDRPRDFVRLETREAERVLEEQMRSMPELQAVETRSMVVTGDSFDGVLRAATDIGADLIVMGTYRKQLLLDIFVGTTIERVIRTGRFPVLMVNEEAQRKYHHVVVAMDMADASVNALRCASSLGLIDDGAILLHAFVPLAKGKMFIAGADQASMDSYVAKERQRSLNEVTAFLQAKGLKQPQWHVRLEEGAPMEAISRAVSQMKPDLLVMGTHGRSGLVKAFIGSVTEEALRSLSVDILVVPPSQR